MHVFALYIAIVRPGMSRDSRHAMRDNENVHGAAARIVLASVAETLKPANASAPGLPRWFNVVSSINQSINHFFINTYADTWEYTIRILKKKKCQYESLNSMRIKNFLSA